jgi:hypothetical protein
VLELLSQTAPPFYLMLVQIMWRQIFDRFRIRSSKKFLAHQLDEGPLFLSFWFPWPKSLPA